MNDTLRCAACGRENPAATKFCNACGQPARLAVRIGMHTGPVVIADGGEVFGETANVAARVQSAAEPDTVVITAATQRLVAGMFVVRLQSCALPGQIVVSDEVYARAAGHCSQAEPVSLSLKGKSEPVRAHVIHARGAA